MPDPQTTPEMFRQIADQLQSGEHTRILICDAITALRDAARALEETRAEKDERVQCAADAIRMWLVQSFRYTAGTIELNKVLVREIQKAVAAVPAPEGESC